MSNKFAVMSILPITFFSYAEDFVSLGEISITTESRFEDPVSTVLAPISVINREDIQKLSANSLVDVLKTLPGVEVGQNGGRGQIASIFLRGTESNHTLVLIDGVRLAASMLSGIDFNSLPLSIIERIEVIRGSGATVYGSDAIGGVINIITRADADGYRFSFGVGSMNTSSTNFSVSQALNNQLTLQVAGSVEQTDGYNVRPSLALEQDEHGFDGKNISARLGYQPNENWKVNVFGLWYQNESGFDNFGTKTFGLVDNKSLGSDISYQVNNWQHLLRVEYTDQRRYEYLPNQNHGENNLNYEINQFFTNYSARLQLFDDLSFTAGADISLEELLAYRTAFSSIDVNRIANNPRRNLGIYGIANWQLHDSWHLEVSSRYDENDQYGGNATGKAALGWDINEKYRAYASAGTAFKSPTFLDLYGFGGNVDIEPEESANYELGVEGFHRYVDWSINAYQNDIDNLITYNNTQSIVENIEKAQIRGLELAAAFDIDIINNRLSLEFRDPVDVSNNKQLSRRGKRLAKWQGALALNKWLLGAQFIYQSERPDSPSSTTILLSYSVWDFTAQYKLSDNVTLRGKIANAFDKDYETADDYTSAERAYYLNVDFTF